MTSYTIFHLSKVGKFVEIINLALKCIVLTNEFDNKLQDQLLSFLPSIFLSKKKKAARICKNSIK